MLSIEFGASAVLIGLLAFAGDSFALTLVLTLILGICVNGAQAGLNGLAASFYPTSIRAAGVGRASGIGRIGSIIGLTLAAKPVKGDWNGSGMHTNFSTKANGRLCPVGQMQLSTTTVDRASIPSPHGSAIKVGGQEPARKMKVESIEEVN